MAGFVDSSESDATSKAKEEKCRTRISPSNHKQKLNSVDLVHRCTAMQFSRILLH